VGILLAEPEWFGVHWRVRTLQKRKQEWPKRKRRLPNYPGIHFLAQLHEADLRKKRVSAVGSFVALIGPFGKNGWSELDLSTLEE
jgi:hypothetical protein